MENHSRTSVSLTEKARTFSVSHSPSLYAGGHSLYTPARCLVHAQRSGARPRFGRQACLLACRQEQDWPASRGGAVQPQNPSVHFIFSMIFIASWQLSAMSYLFVCFSFQLQRKLHKLMALFYSCLNYNLSNCALCTKGFQSQLHGQMDRKVHGSRCTSNNENWNF